MIGKNLRLYQVLIRLFIAFIVAAALAAEGVACQDGNHKCDHMQACNIPPRVVFYIGLFAIRLLQFGIA